MTPLFYHRAAVVIGILHLPYLLGPLAKALPEVVGELNLDSFGSFFLQKQVPCSRKHCHAPSAVGREARVPRRAGREAKSLLTLLPDDAG